MSEERQETIEDVVADIRAQNQGLPEDGYALSPLVCDLLSFADRIEAAANRQFREGTKLIPHEEVTVAEMQQPLQPVADCHGFNAASMRKALEKFNVVDLSGLEFPLDGDSSTIYNSNKKEITIPYCRIAELLNGVKAAQDMAKAALSAPPRNCDVGTAEEQSDRFDKFCYSHSKCHKCPVKSIWNSQHRQKQLREIIRCEIIWSQMPYEEGGMK